MNAFSAIVDVEIVSGTADRFEAAMESHIRNTRNEPGNIAFHFLKSTAFPESYVFFEVFVDRAAYDQHHVEEHYLRWRDYVAPFMKRPRTRTFWIASEPRVEEP